jgi:multisubunit Na+/H+ antiporter MnhG subunit
VLLASMIWFGLNGKPSLYEMLITLFLSLTAPASALLLIKEAMRTDPAPRRPRPPSTAGAKASPSLT